MSASPSLHLNICSLIILQFYTAIVNLIFFPVAFYLKIISRYINMADEPVFDIDTILLRICAHRT